MQEELLLKAYINQLHFNPHFFLNAITGFSNE